MVKNRDSIYKTQPYKIASADNRGQLPAGAGNSAQKNGNYENLNAKCGFYDKCCQKTDRAEDLGY
jgi:hypothetical protein